MERVKLEVRPREGRGGNDARALREAGDVPGVVYGAKTAGGDAIAVAVSVRDLRHSVGEAGNVHAIFDLEVHGETETRPVVIKDLQLDPVRDRVLHVDFHEVRLDQPIQTVVAVTLEGQPHGVTMGGVISQPVHDLNIEALPADIPEGITLDISALEIGGSLRLADVDVPPGVVFLDDLESTVLVSVSAPIAEEEPEVEEELAEGEAAEAGEGEEPAEEPALEE